MLGRIRCIIRIITVFTLIVFYAGLSLKRLFVCIYVCFICIYIHSNVPSYIYIWLSIVLKWPCRINLTSLLQDETEPWQDEALDKTGGGGREITHKSWLYVRVVATVQCLLSSVGTFPWLCLAGSDLRNAPPALMVLPLEGQLGESKNQQLCFPWAAPEPSCIRIWPLTAARAISFWPGLLWLACP